MTTKWIVALISPRDVAPHPNFRGDSWHDLDKAEQVAGVVRNDWRISSRLVFEGRISQGELLPLPNALYMSLQQDTASAGVSLLSDLMELVQEGTPEACATAVLFAVAASENDDYVAALAALRKQLGAITGESPEARLWRVILQLQIGLRLSDAALGQETPALQTLTNLQTITAQQLQPYETIGGVGRPSVSVFEDVLGALTSAALSQVSADTDVSVGTTTERAWVVGQRRGMAALIARIYSSQASKYVDLTNLLVSRQIGSQQVSSLQDLDLFFDLLQFEILGHSGARHMRAELAYFRLSLVLETGQTGLADDCIRLLRHSAEVNKLEAVLRWVRQNGPLDVISSDARRILFSRQAPSELRTVELSVLSASMDLLSIDECAVAMRRLLDARGAIKLPPELPNHLSAEAMRLGPAVRVVARAASACGQSDTGARAILNLMRVYDNQASLLDRQVATAVDDLDWRSVDPLVINEWVEFVAAGEDWTATREQGSFNETLRPVSNSVPPATTQARTALILVAEKLNALMRKEVSVDDLFGATRDEDVDLVRSRLILAASEAESGVHTMYGEDACDIAAGLIVDAGALELWPDLIAFFANPVIWRNDKVYGLERLARASEPVLPAAQRNAAVAAWTVLRDYADEPFRDGPTIHPFPAGLRFALAYGLIATDEAASLVSSMIGSRDVLHKRQGARTLSTVARRNDASWARPLALVASYDHDAVVRSWAAVALVRGGDLLAREGDRLRELLVEDGVDVPMAVLSNLNQEHLELGVGVTEALRRLSRDHPSRTVRKAAAALPV